MLRLHARAFGSGPLRGTEVGCPANQLCQTASLPRAEGPAVLTAMGSSPLTAISVPGSISCLPACLAAARLVSCSLLTPAVVEALLRAPPPPAGAHCTSDSPSGKGWPASALFYPCQCVGWQCGAAEAPGQVLAKAPCLCHAGMRQLTHLVSSCLFTTAAGPTLARRMLWKATQ